MTIELPSEFHLHCTVVQSGYSLHSLCIATLSILNSEVTMTAHSSYNGHASTLLCPLCKCLYVSTQLSRLSGTYDPTQSHHVLMKKQLTKA